MNRSKHYWTILFIRTVCLWSLAHCVLAVDPLPPLVISEIPDQVTTEGRGVAVVFTFSGSIIPTEEYRIAVISSNEALAPWGNMSMNGSGSHRSLHITPVQGQIGTALIEIGVGNLFGQVGSQSFLLIVNPAPVPPPAPPPASSPTPSPTRSEKPYLKRFPSDQTVMMNEPTAPLELVVGDFQTPPSALRLSGTSSNQRVVFDEGIRFGGSDAYRTVTVFPVTNAVGTAIITITATDPDGNSTKTSFQVVVKAPSQPPRISPITDQVTRMNRPTGRVPFTVSDDLTAPEQLIVTATFSDPSLIAFYSLEGSSSNRTVSITPATNRVGTVLATLMAKDGDGMTGTSAFKLSILPSFPPSISEIQHQRTLQNTTARPISFTIADAATSPSDLKISVTAFNQVLVPSSNILLSGTGTNRTIVIIPANDQLGI